MIYVIAAVSKNGIIGKNGKIPWNIPADLAYFKKLTMGCTVVMGRKTYESIGHPLPRRLNIVISSSKVYAAENCITVKEFGEALDLSHNTDVFICGGYSVYKEALPYADKLYITEVDESFEGDTFFPEFDQSQYQRTVIREMKDQYNYRFVVYDRIV